MKKETPPAEEPSAEEVSLDPAASVPAATAKPPLEKPSRRPPGTTSNLDVVAKILGARGDAMTIAEIVEAATGEFSLPTRSRTPRTVVSRDLALDVRKQDSRFVRVAPGTFALRSLSERE